MWKESLGLSIYSTELSIYNCFCSYSSQGSILTKKKMIKATQMSCFHCSGVFYYHTVTINYFAQKSSLSDAYLIMYDYYYYFWISPCTFVSSCMIISKPKEMCSGVWSWHVIWGRQSQKHFNPFQPEHFFHFLKASYLSC